MIRTLLQLVQDGCATAGTMFPELPEYSRGLPRLTDLPCNSCEACVQVCPTRAITVELSGKVELDLGLCIACGECHATCPTGTIQTNRSTQVAVTRRQQLVLSTEAPGENPSPVDAVETRFLRSLHVREVSTGDNASDLEVAAANNPIFDASRFGVHFVASPRFADALVVTGPVARAMREPLRRCYQAMAEPRLVIAAGASAISGGLHRGGYAQADGVEAVLPVAVYVPGHPPHPWYLLHGILLAMGGNRGHASNRDM